MISYKEPLLAGHPLLVINSFCPRPSLVQVPSPGLALKRVWDAGRLG